QRRIKRDVAVKIVRPDYTNKPAFIRRFEKEAEIVARLEHPNIVPLYDFWREPNGAFLVMRYLGGGTLRAKIQPGGQPLDTVAVWLLQLTDALTLSHREGVIHRDIKPANVLLDDDGAAYLVDFGLAKLVDSISTPDSSGTLGYAAPEQFMGEKVDERADIFSLGVVLYEMLTGERGFAGADGLQRLINNPLPDIRDAVPDLPVALNEFIQKATAKNRDDRYNTVGELYRAFTASIHGENIAVAAVASPVDEYAVVLTAPNPYRGLAAFREHDEGNFHGRDSLVSRLLERLQQTELEARFLAVVGPSGSGKSSVVRAGLLPQLRDGALPGSDDWYIVDMFPGAKPFEELEARLLKVAVNPPVSLLDQLRGENGIGRAVKRVLPEGTGDMLLVIDQFEELFTLTPEAKRLAFLDALLDALHDPRGRLRVVITLRADFYGRPLSYLDFGELLRKRTEFVLPMREDDLREAIEQPAKAAGATFEAGLVQSIINDVGREPGSLPLLQYALTELYNNRKGTVLTHDAYTALGGIAGALAQRAEAEYNALPEAQRDVVRQVFLRLVTPGEGTEDTRRRVSVYELDDTPDVAAVLAAFDTARLLTTDRDPETRAPTVEIAHEALIRSWERLRQWLETSRDELLIRQRLTTEVNDWLQADREPGLLAGGTRLEQFEGFVRSSTLTLSQTEQEFVTASHEQGQSKSGWTESVKSTSNIFPVRQRSSSSAPGSSVLHRCCL
ncbi:MAG: serine/threonine-protein kinase, partial [Chloroflexota bacterium]